MTLRSGLRATLDQSALGYNTVGELHAQLDTHETQITNLETGNPTVVAVTATSDGLTTGLIPATAAYVTVTCANAAHIVTLPTASVGKQITVHVITTAVHVRTAASSNLTINNVDADGGAADADVPVSHTVVFTKVTATGWVTSAITEAGIAYTVVVA